MVTSTAIGSTTHLIELRLLTKFVSPCKPWAVRWILKISHLKKIGWFNSVAFFLCVKTPKNSVLAATVGSVATPQGHMAATEILMATLLRLLVVTEGSVTTPPARLVVMEGSVAIRAFLQTEVPLLRGRNQHFSVSSGERRCEAEAKARGKDVKTRARSKFQSKVGSLGASEGRVQLSTPPMSLTPPRAFAPPCLPEIGPPLEVASRPG